MKSIWIVIAITALLAAPLGAFAQEPIPDEDLDLDEIETLGPGIAAPEGEEIEQPSVDEGVSFSADIPVREEGTLKGVTPGIYLIAGGDNLWDICSRFLGNPFEWPKLWSINQYITNPHFIYPGDKIIFHPGTETTMPSMEVAKEVDLTDAEGDEIGEEEPVKAAPKPRKVEIQREPAEYKIRLKTVSFLTKKELEESGTITHSGEPKKILSAGDRIYLRFRDHEKVNIDDEYMVFDTITKVRHPRGGKFMGYQILNKGKIKILSKDKMGRDYIFTGHITDNIRVIERGDRVVPYQSGVVNINPKESSAKVTGFIIGSEPEHRLIGQQEFAYIDLGTNNGMEEGTLLYVVRRGDGLGTGQDKKLPYVIVGKLVVVKAKDRTSTVFVIDSRDSLEAGDEIKTRL